MVSLAAKTTKCLLFYTIVSLYLVQCSKFNPDEDLNTLQIIRRHGYPAESHIVKTEDGYLLEVHRIPGLNKGNRNSQPVFLQHRIFLSSIHWVIEGNTSLAFLLADAGYDVWLGNARGNTYSRGHTSLKLDSNEFWNFSWHEMGVYDLPAVFDLISKTTGKGGEILYAGHSMGTTMAYVFAALIPQSAKKVKLMVSLAPIAYMNHIRSPIKYILPVLMRVVWTAQLIHLQFHPNSSVIRFLFSLCKYRNVMFICNNLLYILFGPDGKGLNQDIMPVVYSNIPEGTSVKLLLHYGQSITSGGKFREYDYGSKKNQIIYDTKNPPPYNLTNIQVPIYLMYAAGDYVSGVQDVEYLSKQLRNLVGMYLVPQKCFNHLDYMYGKEAPEFVYKPLIELFRRYK